MQSSSFLPDGYDDWKKNSVSPILLTTLAELARIAARGSSTDALLGELAQLTMMATTVDGAGTMSCTGTTVRFVHADSPRTSKVDQLQEQLQQGPCRTSVQTEQPVAVRDFAAAAVRRQWPDLAPVALDVGLHSTLAVPLLARERVWGVLDVYRDQPHHWTFADLLISKTLADVVVSLLVLTSDLEGVRVGDEVQRPTGTSEGETSENATDTGNGNDMIGDTGTGVRAELLQATLAARLARLNSRLNATRAQSPPQIPSSEK